MAERIRLDKWLHQARFFKTRTLSATIVSAGHVRINSEKSVKPSAQVGPDDVLTFAQGRRIRVVRILACGTRRGPPAEAQMLYEDLSPEPEPSDRAVAERPEGQGRPTKKDRRALYVFKSSGD